LNATIEATRAGEADRGFAIAAQEVKALAQTAKATEEIETQMQGMQVGATESVSAIKDVGGTRCGIVVRGSRRCSDSNRSSTSGSELVAARQGHAERD